MIFNLADDSRNIVFRKGSSSVDFKQENYFISFKSNYSNMYLTNTLSTTNDWWDTNILYIQGTVVDDNDSYLSLSWDRTDLPYASNPSFYGKSDITGYYTLELRATNLFPVINKPILSTLCKVVNDWNDSTIYDVNKGTRVQEDGAEFIYYRQ